MKRNILPFYALTLSILLAVGCAVPEEEDPLTLGYIGGGDRGGEEEFPGEVNLEHNPMAIVEYVKPDFSDPAIIERYSQASVVILVPSFVWGDGIDPEIINNMKAINPNLKVLGYFNAHSTFLRWSTRDDTSYQASWFQDTRPYWSYTTTGDTMMSWTGKVVLNILDENCREAMVNVLAEQWAVNENVFDGVFWDHFNTLLWVSNYVEGREGEMDLDGNGIPHRDDPDEMQAYREASTALVQRFSDVLGPDVIQVTNGNRAAKDSVFAAMVDGMMYEIFPEVGFGGDEMRSALNPSTYNNLFAANDWPKKSNGGPFLILTNKRQTRLVNGDGDLETWRMADFNRVVALLTDNRVTYHPESETHSYGWPEIELNLGEALSGVTINGETISREFESGKVMLDFTTGSSGAPFNFQIEQNGQIVQEFMVLP